MACLPKAKLTYVSKCQHCGEDVAYYGIWEAELHWNHRCKELIAYEKRLNEDTVIGKWRKENDMG